MAASTELKKNFLTSNNRKQSNKRGKNPRQYPEQMIRESVPSKDGKTRVYLNTFRKVTHFQNV